MDTRNVRVGLGANAERRDRWTTNAQGVDANSILGWDFSASTI